MFFGLSDIDKMKVSDKIFVTMGQLFLHKERGRYVRKIRTNPKKI